MKASGFQAALLAGGERLAAWADVVDGINVFPVADGDTGRNMVLSLLPVFNDQSRSEALADKILLAARGNSGNILAHFLSGLLSGEGWSSLAVGVAEGERKARLAVADPRPGTMLTLLDRFTSLLPPDAPILSPQMTHATVEALAACVMETRTTLEEARKAGVVDSGALGLFLFLEGFLYAGHGWHDRYLPLTERFGDSLRLAPGLVARPEQAYCVDAIVKLKPAARPSCRFEGPVSDSISTIVDGHLKLHFHVSDLAAAREGLSDLGRMVSWRQDDLRKQNRRLANRPTKQALHLVTDAAGSLPLDEAAAKGISLLDSYISLGDGYYPETQLTPDDLYRAMNAGVKVTTSQASQCQRSQTFEKILQLHSRCLYLCVGSAFTGNAQFAADFCRRRQAAGRMRVVDTGAASGRLGLLAWAVADFSSKTDDPEAVLRFADKARPACRELIFLDTMKFLAAGGRVPKAKAWLGKMLNLKPVVTPTSQGVKKVAVLQTRAAQLTLARKTLGEALGDGQSGTVVLQYTDNQAWLEKHVLPALKQGLPLADFRLWPLSLTTGAHCGPGAWAVAWLPGLMIENINARAN